MTSGGGRLNRIENTTSVDISRIYERGPFLRWDAPKLLERPTLIEITGSTAIDPTIPEGPQKHLTEATLTIRMDAKAAIQLSEQIWDLVRTSGLQ